MQNNNTESSVLRSIKCNDYMLYTFESKLGIKC
jgi:hypothetical protein